MKRLATRAVLTALLALGALTVVTAATAGPKAGGTIKFMVIAAVATPIQNYPDAIVGAQAAAAALNKTGGINGQQVVIESCNTQSQANVAVSCARQAVEDKVAAVIGHASTLTTLEEPILQQGGVPDVGLFSYGNPVDWTSPNVFPIVGGVAASYQAVPFWMKKLGKKRFAIIFQDVPSSATNAKNVKNASRVAGLPVACSILLPGSTTDFAPIAQKLRECNADAAMFITSPGVSGGLIRTATSLGLKPLWSHNNGSIGEPEAAQIGAPSEGMLLAAPFPTFRDTKFAGIRKWNAEMKAAGKTEPADTKPNALNSWLAIHGVALLAKKINGPVTATNLTAALRAQKKPLDLFGLASWSPGARGPAAYPRWNGLRVYPLTVKNGQEGGYPGLAQLNPMVAQHFIR
jgi:ABC-type branched-subunit amino acid transport system substrate-binding protein